MKYIRIDIGQVPLLRPVVSQVRHIGDQLVDGTYDPSGRPDDGLQIGKEAAEMHDDPSGDSNDRWRAKLHSHRD
jgi:hypothetical protein